ncbi:MAG: cytochrome c biogenesis protein CcsA [PS1 clade bacterium]
MALSYLSVVAFLISSFLLARYFTKDEIQHQHQQTIALLISFAITAQAIGFSNFWSEDGIIFGLANSASFSSWLIVILLFLASFTKPVHALGILVYPIAAMTILFGIVFPDSGDKIIPLSIASHVFLSITAYALLALSLCQSVLLKIQETHLHERKINGFINKLPALQTMEGLLFQSLRMGFYLLTLSLLTGFFFIDDFFAQHLIYKTTLSLVAWVIFAALVVGRKVFGWRGKQAILATQVGFGVLLVAYFGSKFVIERLI